MLPDGSVNPGEMTSFNHYALGAVADWLHRTVAGLAPAAPGYRELLVHPRPSIALTSASARHLTPYGEAGVAWERADGRFHLRVRVPVGTTARVFLPGAGEPVAVGHGEHHWEVADPFPQGRDLVTVRDVLDDPATWSAIVTAAVETGVAAEGEAQAAGRLAAYLDAPASDVTRALSVQGSLPGTGALRHRVDAILRSTIDHRSR
jgi:alpha-L-rhamnosidase